MLFSNVVLLLASLALGSPLEERAAGCKGISKTESARVVKKLKKSGLTGGLLPKFKPKNQISILYGKKEVDLGTVFTTLQTRNEPEVTFSAVRHAPENATYSVFMVDPDVPEQGPATVNYLHWYFAHAKPKCVKSKAPKSVTAYELPTPGSNTQHRYTFAVYLEPKGYKPKTIPAQQRPGFQLDDYTKEAGLKIVGANYFLEAITNGIGPE